MCTEKKQAQEGEKKKHLQSPAPTSEEIVFDQDGTDDTSMPQCLDDGSG